MLHLIFQISILTVILFFFVLMFRKRTGTINSSPPSCEKPKPKKTIPSNENQKPAEKKQISSFLPKKQETAPVLINREKQVTVKTQNVAAAIKTATANHDLGKKQNKISSYFDKSKENEQKQNELVKQQNIPLLSDKELKEKEQTLSMLETVRKNFIECFDECNGHDKPSVYLDNAKNKLNSQIIIASLIIGNIKKDINRSRFSNENYAQFLKKESENFKIFINTAKTCCQRFLAPQIQDILDILNGKYGEIRFRFEGSKDHRAIKMSDSEINEEINGVINNATQYLHQSAVNRKNSEIRNQEENLNNKNRNFIQLNYPKPPAPAQTRNSGLKQIQKGHKGEFF